MFTRRLTVSTNSRRSQNSNSQTQSSAVCCVRSSDRWTLHRKVLSTCQDYDIQTKSIRVCSGVRAGFDLPKVPRECPCELNGILTPEAVVCGPESSNHFLYYVLLHRKCVVIKVTSENVFKNLKIQKTSHLSHLLI